MRTVLLVARREVIVRLQQRGFRIGLAVAVIIIALGAAAPKIIGGHAASTYQIGVVGGSEELRTYLDAAAKQAGQPIRLHPTDATEAAAKVRSGDWDAAVINGDRIVAKSSDSGAVTLIQSAHQAQQLRDNLAAAGLTGIQIQHAFEVKALAVTATNSAETTQRQVVATIAVVFLFAQLLTFCTWVAIGVVEEKSSRVVELILSAVRPVQLLTGKLVGIGGLALAQVALLALVALGVSIGTGGLTLPGSAYVSLLVAFGWFALGFAFFAALAAGLASLVSRQEEVSGVLTPVTGLLFVAYAASFAVSANPDTSWARVLSMIPPISAIAMPARLARGGVPITDVLAAALLMLALTAVALVVAGRLYRASILHTGNKLTLRSAWRGEAVGDLA
ncbi:ABC-2 type transport system permease protein [Jatrophihabitans sp. GAS493]|uniref:ABC transporter permease n=1 Tax=Jatrophihabitans sp. GAS493 TaxID=1907575 RepID=UPI000BC059CE|nr:ABC transporter permease [Jatrophihabitans sp. GAS493]SOD70411.1 ABC-2 type transport system permease protein [Jatrophihabitans sp. GAS493]